jgi:RNA polymerase sigma-70 factor (ECF subfamily)
MRSKPPINSIQTIDPENWIDQYGNYLFRYALLRLQSPEVAEDMVQETFLAALKGRDSFAGQSSEKTWLVGILKHKIIDYIRRCCRERPISSDEFSDKSIEDFFDQTGHLKNISHGWSGDPNVVLEQKEFRGILDYCLSELPSRMTQAFTLREVEGLQSEEICEILNISTSNLHVMLYRVRSHLRHCLEINWFGLMARKN